MGTTTWGCSDLDQYSPARTNLEDQVTELLARLPRQGIDWGGPQYLAFREHADGLVTRMQETAAHFSTVGDVLVDIADAFEMRWYEVIGWVVTAAGFVIAIVGLADAIYTASTVVGAIAGLVYALLGMIVAAIGMIITYLSSVVSRLAALDEAVIRLAEVEPPVRWLPPETP